MYMRIEIESIKNKPIIISGFPAIGKSFLFNTNCNLSVLDSDSSKFSWIAKGVRNPDFPNNYIEHIKSNIGMVDIILMSSHDIVRKALKDNNINYTIVYPCIGCKDEYIQRFELRGNDKQFIDFISSNWEKFILDIDNETFPTKIKLQSGQYLKDIL